MNRALELLGVQCYAVWRVNGKQDRNDPHAFSIKLAILDRHR